MRCGRVFEIDHVVYHVMSRDVGSVAWSGKCHGQRATGEGLKLLWRRECWCLASRYIENVSCYISWLCELVVTSCVIVIVVMTRTPVHMKPRFISPRDIDNLVYAEYKPPGYVDCWVAKYTSIRFLDFRTLVGGNGLQIHTKQCNCDELLFCVDYCTINKRIGSECAIGNYFHECRRHEWWIISDQHKTYEFPNCIINRLRKAPSAQSYITTSKRYHCAHVAIATHYVK